MRNTYQLETVICRRGSAISALSTLLTSSAQQNLEAQQDCLSPSKQLSLHGLLRLHGGQGELEATKEGVGVSTAARSNASGSKDESRSSRDAEMTPEQVNDAEPRAAFCAFRWRLRSPS
eukprot:1582249-Prymnesium_polylepis.1